MGPAELPQLLSFPALLPALPAKDQGLEWGCQGSWWGDRKIRGEQPTLLFSLKRASEGNRGRSEASLAVSGIMAEAWVEGSALLLASPMTLGRMVTLSLFPHL